MDVARSRSPARLRLGGSKQELSEKTPKPQQPGRQNGSGAQQHNPQLTSQTPEMQPGSYVPCPRITFLINKPARLSCGICYGTILMTGRLPTPDEAKCFPHRAPALLPCGHIACHACLERNSSSFSSPSSSPDPDSESNSNNSRCPFCRFQLRYELCRHRVPPRVLDSQSVWAVPRTVPDGGTVPGQCGPCRQRSDLEVARCTWRALACDYEATRARLRGRSGDVINDDRYARLLEVKYEQMERALAVALRGGDEQATTTRGAEW